MRIYHKLHKNPCKTERAELIRNITKRIAKLARRSNPDWRPGKPSQFQSRGESPRSIFEEIFSYKQELESFHGLEVEIIGAAKHGGRGYIAEHPWFPPDEKTKRKQIKFGVCGPKKAREIGAVSVTRLDSIGLLKKPLFGDEEKKGFLVEEVGALCCLAEKPETPARGEHYAPGVLLCTGKRRFEDVKIGIGKRPDDAIRDLHRELENLRTEELRLLDVRLGPGAGRVRPGPVSRAKKAYIESDPLSPESPRLGEEYKSLQLRLSDVQSRRRGVEEDIRRGEAIREEAVGGTSLSLGRRKKIRIEEEGKTQGEIDAERRALETERKLYSYRPTREVSARALGFRHGEEEADRLAFREKEFKDEYLLSDIQFRRRGVGDDRRIPLNERFAIGDTPLSGVIWDGVALDDLTGKTTGTKGKFTWVIYDGAGNTINSGTIARTKSGAGKATAARFIKKIARETMSGKGAHRGDREVRGAESRSIQEALLTKRAPPPLVIGEHLIAQFIPREKIKITKHDAARSRSNWRDIMRWGLPTPYALAEFSRDLAGYHVTYKLPSGQKETASTKFDNMKDAVEYAMLMIQGITGINTWMVEEGPRWSGASEKGRTRERRRNPSGKLRARRNPGLFDTVKDILALPLIARPKRKRESITATAVPKVGKHFRDIARQLYGKEAFDFGFTFGVLRGIDTCGLKDLVERRRIRQYIEQQVIDAVYSLTVEAPARREGNPGREKAGKKTIRWNSWNPNKNPDAIDALKDIVAPQFLMRPKRKRESISVAELPDLKQHFVDMAWSLNGQAGFDFGFVFGVLRGIDTCGLANIGERNRIRRRVEQELMDAAYGLSVEAPGSNPPVPRE